ncbi:MAG: hypothetical protein EPN62_19910 [Candidimonas sp.]|nr:MAG: hypothetical protein EPN62_19910 [Candidimonas sp.]
MKRTLIIIAVSLLAGCAAPMVWNKDGATQQDFYMESGQCKAQAFSIAGAPIMQIAIVYNSCMEGHGWYKGVQQSQQVQLAPGQLEINPGWKAEFRLQ